MTVMHTDGEEKWKLDAGQGRVPHSPSAAGGAERGHQTACTDLIGGPRAFSLWGQVLWWEERFDGEFVFHLDKHTNKHTHTLLLSVPVSLSLTHTQKD